MNLTTVKRSDFPATRGTCSKPKLLVSGRLGTIGFNKAAIVEHGLKKGDHIMFLKDADEDPADWFVVLPPAALQDPDIGFLLSQSSSTLKTGAKKLAQMIILDFLKKKYPNKKEAEHNLEVVVHFTVATKPALDGESELPDTYAIL